jgi:hypothetical protein
MFRSYMDLLKKTEAYGLGELPVFRMAGPPPVPPRESAVGVRYDVTRIVVCIVLTVLLFFRRVARWPVVGRLR